MSILILSSNNWTCARASVTHSAMGAVFIAYQSSIFHSGALCRHIRFTWRVRRAINDDKNLIKLFYLFSVLRRSFRSATPESGPKTSMPKTKKQIQNLSQSFVGDTNSIIFIIQHILCSSEPMELLHRRPFLFSLPDTLSLNSSGSLSTQQIILMIKWSREIPIATAIHYRLDWFLSQVAS